MGVLCVLFFTYECNGWVVRWIFLNILHYCCVLFQLSTGTTGVGRSSPPQVSVRPFKYYARIHVDVGWKLEDGEMGKRGNRKTGKPENGKNRKPYFWDRRIQGRRGGGGKNRKTGRLEN